mgnify:CR=1 FL=1
MTSFSESVVEDAALGWLDSLGYAVPESTDSTHDTLMQVDDGRTKEIAG